MNTGKDTKMLIFKTMHHFFPGFNRQIKRIDDPRNKGADYPASALIWEALLMYLLKLGARRQINYEFATDEMVKNIALLSGNRLDKISHDSVVSYLYERLDPVWLRSLRRWMVRSLVRGKCLGNERLLGCYAVVLDGTGYLAFKDRHCKHCLYRQIKDKKGKVVRTYYYHPVVEAKLVTESGLALSVGTEFVENADRDVDVQDCELRAAYRLMERLKHDFPQLRICLLLDSLYAAKPVIDRCDEYKWKYITTFKQGSMPEVWDEYCRLQDLQPENTAERTCDTCAQEYRWVTDIDFRGPRFDVVSCTETKQGKKGLLERKTFVWLTNFHVGRDNFKVVAAGGRMRWKIENEGFNIQKTGGYNMEHAYSKHEVGLKNFYLTLQIAHIISQLMEKGSLLAANVKKLFGSIRNFSRRLLESLRMTAFDPAELAAVRSSRFQIRLRGPD